MNKKSRRNVLKGLSVGGTSIAVTSWHKPVVQSVILPAHAQTSCLFCVTISITGASGGAGGGGGFKIRDPNRGCEIIAEDRHDGQSGTGDTFCVPLAAPGAYGLFLTGGGDTDTFATVIADCCGTNQFLGPTEGASVFFNLLVAPAGCAFANPTVCPPT